MLLNKDRRENDQDCKRDESHAKDFVLEEYKEE